MMNYGQKILCTWARHLTLRRKNDTVELKSVVFAGADSSVDQGTEKSVPSEVAEGLSFLSGSTAGFVSTFHL